MVPLKHFQATVPAIISFPDAGVKYTDRRNLREKGFILAHTVRGTIHHGTEAGMAGA